MDSVVSGSQGQSRAPFAKWTEGAREGRKPMRKPKRLYPKARGEGQGDPYAAPPHTHTASLALQPQLTARALESALPAPHRWMGPPPGQASGQGAGTEC